MKSETPAALALDTAAVITFCAIGRRSHAEGVTVSGVAETAWPFLTGTATGWLLSRGWRRPDALTPTGRVEVEAWLHEAEPDASWADFVSHVLMAASLPHAPVASLLASYRRLFAGKPAAVDASPSLGALASARFDEAALDWLDSVDAVLQKPHTLARPLGEIRPRRGRRPRQAVG